jgi:hypothetical protein
MPAIDQGAHDLTSRGRQHGGANRRAMACAPLLLSVAILSGCSSLALPKQAMPTSEPSYVSLTASYLKTTLKNYSSYDAFEISGLRWVDAMVGWSWLVCVRFRDRGHERSYALFIQGDAVVAGRYAVQADACGAQAYMPFDLMAGGKTQPGGIEPQALY